MPKRQLICQSCKKRFNSYEEEQKYCSRDCYNKGHIVWNKGKKLHYMPPAVFKKGEHIGKKHLNWKGGKWLYWRKQALIRDDYTCQDCGLRDEEIMDVDHVKPRKIYPDLKLVLSNLRTLCPNCHKRKTVREAKKTNTH